MGRGRKPEDLTDKKFNKLTAIEITNKRDNNRSVIWKCQCDCGNIVYVSSRNLKNNKRTSCGCSHKISDIINKKFGSLLVLKKLKEQDSSRHYYYLCQCDCGKQIKVTGTDLITKRKFCCPSCSTNFSRGEKIIADLLIEHQISFYSQYRFKDCRDKKTLPFDFYLPEENILIEFDGSQHQYGMYDHSAEYYINHDVIKSEYAIKNKIPLIRISYKDISKISWDYFTEQKKKAQELVKQVYEKNVSQDEADAICIGLAGIQEREQNRSAF